MRRRQFVVGSSFLLGAAALGLDSLSATQGSQPPAGGTPWSYDATYIEACSCHLFCPCYFNTTPEMGSCEFQMAVRVNDGMFGDVALKGAKFWLTGDLGEEFGTKHRSPWVVVTFDPAVTPAQRDGLAKILIKGIYQDFDKIETDESAISWSINSKEGIARAQLANGKGEMLLERWKGNDGGPSILQNVKYFNAKSNRGFVMYKSKMHRWDGFGHKFEYSGLNAFTIRILSDGTI